MNGKFAWVGGVTNPDARDAEVEALRAENERLRAQLDNMTIEWASTYVADDESDTPVFEAQNEADARRYTEGRVTTGSFAFAFHTVKRLVGPWVDAEGDN